MSRVVVSSRLLKIYVTSIFNALLGIAFVSAVHAQTTSGRISGTVKDAADAVIPNATITVTNEETNLTRDATTDENGFFVVTNLPAGIYSVAAERKGFKKSLKTGYALAADARLTVDFILDTGDIAETIEVTSAVGESVNTTSGEVARIVDGEQVRNLALNTRNYVELFSLIPGAVLTTDDPLQLASGSSSGQTAINGNRAASNNLTVDGGYNLSPTNNAIIVNNVGIDFIQEVKIQTSNFSAEYGRHSGAAVNVVTRGGTNRFHGSVFEFIRNDALDAKAFFSPEKPALRYNNFGYSLGGPILKNKLFFFGGQEWKYIRRATNPVRRTLPTTAELNGDFSSRLRGPDGIVGTADDGVLRDPLRPSNTCVAPTISNGVVTRPAVRTGCFPGNIIPANRITPDGRAIASVYRTAAQLAAVFIDEPLGNNATFQPPNPFDFRQDILRLDYRFNENHSIYGRFIHDINDFATPYGPAGESQLPVTPVTRIRPGNTYLAQHTWIVSPTMTNEARFNVNDINQRSFPVGETWKRETHGFVFSQLFLGELYDNGIPDVAVTGFASFRGPSFALRQPNGEIVVNDNFTIIRGNHTAKFGASYIRSRIDQNGRPRYTGNVNFTAASNPNSTFNAFADALLGNFRTYTEAADEPLGFFRFTEFDVFVTDTWKLHPRLNIEYGLRFQHGVPFYTQGNNLANFDPRLYDPAQAVTITRDGLIDTSRGGNRFNGLVRAGSGVPQSELERVPNATSQEVLSVPAAAPRGLFETSNRLAPRISFAYAPFSDNKTAIRGGFGIFYDRPAGDFTISLINNPPFNTSVNLENGNLANLAASAVSALTPFAGITAIDPDLEFPYTMNFSLSVQRELPRGLFVDLAYVGNLGRHLLRNPNINQVPLELLAANLQLPANQRAAENALRPYKGYSTINQLRSDSNSNYHALQLYVTKRKGDFRFTGSYTWSKVLTDASASNEDPENPSDRSFNYGPATFDRRHVFVSTYTYRFPLFRGARGWTRALLYGYEVSGITRMQTGPYLTVTGTAPTGGTRRADYIGGEVLLPDGERGPDNWINRAAFAIAPANRRGNSGVGIVQAPGLQVWNLSLRKITRLTERVTLRLQADIFNAFNRANFTSLNTNLSAIDFGQLDSTGQPRQVQFGIKLEF
jgi:hypothetical protein